MSMCGGFSQEEKESGSEEQMMLDALKEEIEAKIGENFKSLTAVSHRTQIVAGTNYLMRVQIDGGEDTIVVKISKPLPHTNKPPFVMEVVRE